MKKIFNFKKLLVSFLAGLVLFLSLPLPALAQQATPGPWYNQNFTQWSTKVFGGDQNEIFGERYTYAQINWIINSLIAVLIGSDISNCVAQYNTGNLPGVVDCLKKFGVTPSSSPGASLNGGAIGGLAFMTNTLLNTRPASGIEYIKTTATRLHIVPEAYAQTGVGFTTLTPIQSLWKVVRDISYTLIVVVVIIMAFMIMFRVKISPQVVISVQSALPKIAIALILITFSYAIAGFLVDLMYVIVGAFAAMIKIGGTSISNGTVPYLFTQLTSGNGLVSIAVGIAAFAIIIFLAGVGLTVAGVAGSVTIVGSPVGIPLLIGGVIILIFAVVFVVVIFRLFWLMVKTAAETVLLIIAGPVMILLGTLSSSGGVGTWIRRLAANLLVYPTVIVMIFLSHYFFWGWFLGGVTGLIPSGVNFLNTFDIRPLDTGGSSSVVNLPGMPIGTGVLGLVLSFMILFIIPRTAHVIEAMVEGKKFDVGGALGEAFGPVRAPIGFIQGAVLGGVGTYVGTQVKGTLERRFGTSTGSESSSAEATGRAGTPTKD